MPTLTPKEWAARKSLLSKIPHFTPPPGGYSLLYPDCPWQYRDKANSGDRGAGHKYATLSLLELKMMRPEIDRISAENSTLVLWATAPMIREALDLMEAWGYSYSTIALTWIKTYPVSERMKRIAKKLQVDADILESLFKDEDLTVMKARIGMGNFTRSNAEFALLGTRGKVVRENAGVCSVIVSEVREHSQKPDEARDALVKLLGDVPRLEMFSRASTPGWDCWGLEAGKFDESEEAAC